MPAKCNIINCKGNYESMVRKFGACRIFHLPTTKLERQQWINAIPEGAIRGNIDLSKLNICEKHWEAGYPTVGVKKSPKFPPSVFDIQKECPPSSSKKKYPKKKSSIKNVKDGLLMPDLPQPSAIKVKSLLLPSLPQTSSLDIKDGMLLLNLHQSSSSPNVKDGMLMPDPPKHSTPNVENDLYVPLPSEPSPSNVEDRPNNLLTFDRIESLETFSPREFLKITFKEKCLIFSRSDERFVFIVMTEDYSESKISIIVEKTFLQTVPLTLVAFKHGCRVPLDNILHPDNGLDSKSQFEKAVSTVVNFEPPGDSIKSLMEKVLSVLQDNSADFCDDVDMEKKISLLTYHLRQQKIASPVKELPANILVVPQTETHTAAQKMPQPTTHSAVLTAAHTVPQPAANTATHILPQPETMGQTVRKGRPKGSRNKPKDLDLVLAKGKAKAQSLLMSADKSTLHKAGCEESSVNQSYSQLLHNICNSYHINEFNENTTFNNALSLGSKGRNSLEIVNVKDSKGNCYSVDRNTAALMHGNIFHSKDPSQLVVLPVDHDYTKERSSVSFVTDNPQNELQRSNSVSEQPVDITNKDSVCEICGKSFPSKIKLQLHLTLHKNKAEFVVKPTELSLSQPSFEERRIRSDDQQGEDSSLISEISDDYHNLRDVSGDECKDKSKQFTFMANSLNIEKQTPDIFREKTMFGKMKIEKMPKMKIEKMPVEENLYECDVCGENLKYFHDFKNHLTLHDVCVGRQPRLEKENLEKKKPYIMKYHIKRDSILHVKNFQCKTCRRKFSSQNCLQEHEGIHCKNACKICGKVYMSKRKLEFHLFLHKNNGKFQCDICKVNLKNEMTFRVHRERHFTEEYMCEICSRTFKDKQNLNHHMMLHSNKEAFQCDICCKNLASPKQLRLHKRRHLLPKTRTNDGFYPCDICGLVYKNKVSLNYHKRIKHEDSSDQVKTIKCSECPKTFETEFGFKIHLRQAHVPRLTLNSTTIRIGKPSHKKRKYFACEICPKTFVCSTSLKRHMNVHNGIKPYKCNFCPKSFYCQTQRQQHQIYHKDKKFSCDICYAKFYRIQHLKSHSSIHTGEKPYPCDVCGRRFRRKDDRNKHQHGHLQNGSNNTTESLEGQLKIEIATDEGKIY